MKKITSISLPVGDMNVWFWGLGRFLMGFYMNGKTNPRHSFFFTVENRENRNGIYFSNCSGYIGSTPIDYELSNPTGITVFYRI